MYAMNSALDLKKVIKTERKLNYNNVKIYMTYF